MVAALSTWHEAHDVAAEATDAVDRLPAHVVTETYSVLTRLPGGLAASPGEVARLLAIRFPGSPLTLNVRQRAALPRRLAEAGVLGGATYDGLVALEAQAHDEVLLTLDRRALATYVRLATDVRVLNVNVEP